MKTQKILLMWSTIVVLTAIGAFLGAHWFPPGSTEDPSVRRIVSAIEGLCGGAMLTMISNTALPEAFEQGGDVVGLSCLLGFLTAVTVSAL